MGKAVRRVVPLAVVSVLASARVAAAQPCTPNVITLSSQSAVTNFQTDHGPCTMVVFDLNIFGADITDLSGLAAITSVGSTIGIAGNPMLASLNGLDALASVSILFINLNPALTDISAVHSLTSAATIVIVGNAALATLDGLDALTSLPGSVTIEQNPALTDLSALSNVTSVGVGLDIRENGALTSLDGLDALASVGLVLTVESNPALTNLAALANLTSVGLNVSITSNASLSNCAGVCALVDGDDDPPPGADVGGITTISGNAAGCNSVAEVQTSCALIPTATQTATATATATATRTVPPSCMDALLDGAETGVDCGGAFCLPCTVGQMCVASSDCQSGICGPMLKCLAGPTATTTVTPTATATATGTGSAPSPTATATGTAGGTATGTTTATPTSTPGATLTATGTATGTATTTQTATPSASPSSIATSTDSPSSTATRTSIGTATASFTASATPTITRTPTVTNTRTTTPTFTPIAPSLTGPVQPGDKRVDGEGTPNRSEGAILICLIGGPDRIPNVPPCQAPDTQLGSCGTDAAGRFTSSSMLGCPLTQPLQDGECIYTYDTVTMLVGNVQCAVRAVPTPALSFWMLGVSLALLGLISALAMRRATIGM